MGPFGAHGQSAESAELIRRNNELKAQIALLNENVVLAQANARLEEQLRATGARFGAVQGEAQAVQLPSLLSLGGHAFEMSKGVADRGSMNQRRQQFMSRNREISEFV